MSKIVDLTLNGHCTNCGGCCSDYLFLDDEEIKRIDEYLKTHKVEQHHTSCNDSVCPFRNDETKRCDIYEVRPYICQKFKCNLAPNEAYKQRDLINSTRKPRSMAWVFFNDKSKAEFLNKIGINITLYGRDEN